MCYIFVRPIISGKAALALLLVSGILPLSLIPPPTHTPTTNPQKRSLPGRGHTSISLIFMPPPNPRRLPQHALSLRAQAHSNLTCLYSSPQPTPTDPPNTLSPSGSTHTPISLVFVPPPQPTPTPPTRSLPQLITHTHTLPGHLLLDPQPIPGVNTKTKVAPSPINIATNNTPQGARTLPGHLLLDPQPVPGVTNITKEKVASSPTPTATNNTTTTITWWGALDAAVARVVGSAATVAFLRPHRWLRLLRLLAGACARWHVLWWASPFLAGCIPAATQAAAAAGRCARVLRHLWWASPFPL